MNPAKTYGNSLGRFVAYSSEYLNFLHPDFAFLDPHFQPSSVSLPTG